MILDWGFWTKKERQEIHQFFCSRRYTPTWHEIVVTSLRRESDCPVPVCSNVFCDLLTRKRSTPSQGGGKNMACENTRSCVCRNVKCKNHGRCCACVANHRAQWNLPFCLYTPEQIAEMERNHPKMPPSEHP